MLDNGEKPMHESSMQSSNSNIPQLPHATLFKHELILIELRNKSGEIRAALKVFFCTIINVIFKHFFYNFEL